MRDAVSKRTVACAATGFDAKANRRPLSRAAAVTCRGVLSNATVPAFPGGANVAHLRHRGKSVRLATTRGFSMPDLQVHAVSAATREAGA